jgi:hypothetical protein
VGVTKVVIISARQGVKYAPHIAAVVREVRGPATDFAKTRVEASRQRRLAVTKAASVRDGSVLQLLHGEQTVWVVYSGDKPVSEHPDIGVPLAELVEHADLDRRRPPEDFPSPKDRASAARKKTVSKVHVPRRRSAKGDEKGDDKAVDKAVDKADDKGDEAAEGPEAPQDRPLSP